MERLPEQASFIGWLSMDDGDMAAVAEETPDSIIWKTKDGRKIKIEDLETDHAINIIKMLLRNNFISAKKYYMEMRMLANIDDIGYTDAEDDAFTESLYHGTLSKMPSFKMDAILDELKRRNIDINNIMDEQNET